MKQGAGRFVFAIIGAVLSAAYWWMVTTIAYGLVGGDRAPSAPPPSPEQQNVTVAIVFAVAVVVYALLTLAWRRIEDRALASRTVGPHPVDPAI